jgi:glycosyltransferase involved in cell wall biosynthesis
MTEADRAMQEARLVRARSRSVFICTPVARHPVRQYTMALAKTLVHLQQLGIRSWMQFVVGNSNLPRARNELVAAFLASDYDDMVFIDDDMGWQPNDLVRLLASDKDLIGAVGCKKVVRPDTDPARWCLRALDGPLVQDAMGAIEVEAVGTGFLKIGRPVLEAMIAAHPDWKRRGWPNMPEAVRAKYHQFFRFDPNDAEEIGEDIAFCREWRGLGGSVWVDPTIRLIHVGEYEYAGDLEALLEAMPSSDEREAAE